MHNITPNVLYMKNRNFIKLGFFCLLFIALKISGQSIPDKPANYVTDLGNYLTNQQQQVINDKLANFEKETQNQLFILIAKNTEGADFTQLTVDIAEKWGVGKKGLDNGILMALFIEDKKLRIEVGYGLEGYITDLVAYNIRVGDMNPFLKKGLYFEAINKGVESLILASGKAYTADKMDDMDGEGGWTGYSELIIPFYILSIFILIFITIQGVILYINVSGFSKKDLNRKISFVGGFLYFILVCILYFYNAYKGLANHDNTNLGVAIIAIFPAAFGIAIVLLLSENLITTTYTASGTKKRINRKPFASSSNWGFGSSYTRTGSSSFSGGGGGSFGGGGSGGSW